MWHALELTVSQIILCYTNIAREFHCTKELAFRFEDLLDIKKGFFSERMVKALEQAVQGGVKSLSLECSRNNWMWYLVLWLSWRGGAQSKVGHGDLGGLFQA